MEKTISLIIPAYNEEENIAGAVESTEKALGNLFDDYEIIIVNDCSTDNTGLVADELAKKNSKIKVIHNIKNMGLGYNYFKGVELASKKYVMLNTGANVIEQEEINKIFKQTGKADIIIPYFINQNIRPLSRRAISKSFVTLMNLATGLNLQYYNAPILLKTKLVKNITIHTYGFTYQSGILSKLLKSGYSFMEVGVKYKLREHGKTKFFRYKQLISLSKIIPLLWDIKIKNRKLYNKKPIRVEG